MLDYERRQVSRGGLFLAAFSADGEQREFQLENFIAPFVFFGEERDFFTEGVDAFYDALVAFLADAERKARNMACARSVAVDGICRKL